MSCVQFRENLVRSNNKAMLSMAHRDARALVQQLADQGLPATSSRWAVMTDRSFRFDQVRTSHDFEYASKPGHFTLELAEPGLLVQQLLNGSAALAQR